MSDLVRLRELASQGPTILACRQGLRSAALARLLRVEGVAKVYALAEAMPAIRPAGMRTGS
jgi:adenylyltransferase/sulfurtransferase